MLFYVLFLQCIPLVSYAKSPISQLTLTYAGKRTFYVNCALHAMHAVPSVSRFFDGYNGEDRFFLAIQTIFRRRKGDVGQLMNDFPDEFDAQLPFAHTFIERVLFARPELRRLFQFEATTTREWSCSKCDEPHSIERDVKDLVWLRCLNDQPRIKLADLDHYGKYVEEPRIYEDMPCPQCTRIKTERKHAELFARRARGENILDREFTRQWAVLGQAEYMTKPTFAPGNRCLIVQLWLPSVKKKTDLHQIVFDEHSQRLLGNYWRLTSVINLTADTVGEPVVFTRTEQDGRYAIYTIDDTGFYDELKADIADGGRFMLFFQNLTIRAEKPTPIKNKKNNSPMLPDVNDNLASGHNNQP